MPSLRHALSAAALAVVGLTACAGTGDVTASPAPVAAVPSTSATPTVAPTFEIVAPTTPATTSAAPTTAPTTTRSAPRTTTPPTTTARPAPTTPAPEPAPEPPPAADTSDAGQVLALVNAERARAGCDPVALDDRLTRAAAGHSQDMATANFFSHDSQDGRSFADRIRATGYPAPRSENLAAGQRTAAAVMESWMNSAGHKANILDCTATEMGLASAEGGDFGIYWTQNFGTA